MARTPLYDAHEVLGATFTDFAGYEMPVHYGSIKDEHATVRTAVGLFDVSHMSKLRVRDDGSEQLSQEIDQHSRHSRSGHLVATSVPVDYRRSNRLS